MILEGLGLFSCVVGILVAFRVCLLRGLLVGYTGLLTLGFGLVV